MVKRLLKAVPADAVRQRDRFGKFPVVCALDSDAKKACVDLIAEKYETARAAYELWEACNRGQWIPAMKIVRPPLLHFRSRVRGGPGRK